MKGTIEITVRTVPGGKVMTNVEDKKCSEKDVLEVMTAGFCAMAANCMRKVPQRMRGQCCAEFGKMMEDTLLVLLNGEAKAAQRFEGKEADFMTELLTRQGEVQDE
nr:MAG TPA: hypothetical protein [Bacteriophage sp.]